MQQITESPSGETPQVIFDRIKEHIPEWGRLMTDLNQLDIRRLSGLSNDVLLVLNYVQIQKGIPVPLVTVVISTQLSVMRHRSVILRF